MRASRQAAGAFGYFARKLSEKCSEEHSTLGSVSGLTASAASVAPEKSDSAMAASSAWFEIRIGSSPLQAVSKPSTDDAKPLHVRLTRARTPENRCPGYPRRQACWPEVSGTEYRSRKCYRAMSTASLLMVCRTSRQGAL